MKAPWKSSPKSDRKVTFVTSKPEDGGDTRWNIVCVCGEHKTNPISIPLFDGFLFTFSKEVRIQMDPPNSCFNFPPTICDFERSGSSLAHNKDMKSQWKRWGNDVNVCFISVSVQVGDEVESNFSEVPSVEKSLVLLGESLESVGGVSAGDLISLLFHTRTFHPQHVRWQEPPQQELRRMKGRQWPWTNKAVNTFSQRRAWGSKRGAPLNRVLLLQSHILYAGVCFPNNILQAAGLITSPFCQIGQLQTKLLE